MVLVRWWAFMILHTFINLCVYLIFIRVWFLTSWACPTNVTLVNVSAFTRVSYLQRFFCLCQYVVCIRLVKSGALCMPTIQKIVQCWFIQDMFIFQKCVSRMTSWMNSENLSFQILEVSYVFVKFLLVFWCSNLCKLLYLLGSTISLW